MVLFSSLLELAIAFKDEDTEWFLRKIWNLKVLLLGPSPLGRKCVKKFKNCWLASMCGAHYPCRYQLAVISIFIWCWLIHIDCWRTAKMLRDCQTPPHKSVFMTSQPPPDRAIDGWIACLKMIEKAIAKRNAECTDDDMRTGFIVIAG